MRMPAADYQALMSEAADKMAELQDNNRALASSNVALANTITAVRSVMTEWNFGPTPDRDALAAILAIVGDNIQERKP